MPNFTVGAIIMLTLIVACYGARLVLGADPNHINPTASLVPPGPSHIFGTDSFGRDLFVRILYGGELSIAASFIAVIISLAGGLIVGFVAGWTGGLTDMVLMRFMDLLLAFPGILLALSISAILGPGLVNALIAIGISSIPVYARLVHGLTNQAKNYVYVESAKIIGASNIRIVLRHILPNIMAPLLVTATTGLGWAMLWEAALSFLGLGVQPPTPDWGSILNSGLDYLQSAWWISVFPGVFITLFVVAVNLMGDGLRDVVDPKNKA
ncbi:ABC transporter permease [Alicyclobacillus mengziensis]|uniref:ABC transporter permease n=1 Tax=Alicyclobacillus mengziensis TaxID=2931921 RepID=A0A9X7Z7P6_9BACL|nr:ABC transporter permease [Alicyclobacillus mengziensis]QSO49324.1 ABC transporter permease [Alicyclobacillus mengziensis]